MGVAWLLPEWKENVWGRRRLAPWGADVDGAPVGEAWLSDVSCSVEGGGTFGELVARDPAGMLGEAAGRAPVLVKLLFTDQVLSVQVHPTDAAARASGVGATGKNEAWHILEAAGDAADGAAVWAGFRGVVTREEVAAACADGSVMGMLARRGVRAGDTVPVPAGTVHAIGPGIVLLEVQDPVLVTYRLFDHGRDRPLQVEEGLGVASFGPAASYAEPARGAVLVEAPRFVLERHPVGSGLVVRPDGSRGHLVVALTAGVVVEGRALAQGRAVFVAASGAVVAVGGAGEVAVVHPGPGATPCLAAG